MNFLSKYTYRSHNKKSIALSLLKRILFASIFEEQRTISIFKMTKHLYEEQKREAL